MCQKLPASWLKEPTPPRCPAAFPSLFERPDGTRYYQECPCNKSNCSVCVKRRRENQLFKAIQGFRYRSWQSTKISIGPGWQLQRNRLIWKLRKLRLMHVSVRRPGELIVFHPTIDGPRHSWKPAFVEFRAIATKSDVQSVRFSRNWPKLTEEVRRANDDRTPEQKHRRVGVSRFCPKLFRQRATEVIDTVIRIGVELLPADVATLLKYRLLSKGSLSAARASALGERVPLIRSECNTAKFSNGGPIARSNDGSERPVPY